MANVKITVTTEDGEILDTTEVPWEEFGAGDWVHDLAIGREVQGTGPKGQKKKVDLKGAVPGGFMGFRPDGSFGFHA